MNMEVSDSGQTYQHDSLIQNASENLCSEPKMKIIIYSDLSLRFLEESRILDKVVTSGYFQWKRPDPLQP
jgi:hypothetical protein